MIRKVHLKNLKVHCIVGIHNEERMHPQDIFIDIDLDYDYSDCIAYEDIHKTLDYSELASLTSKFIFDKKFLLLETLVEETTKQIVHRWPEITYVKIKVKKPAAVPAASYAAITFEKAFPPAS